MERACPEFLPSNALRPQYIVVLDAFGGIKNTKIDFGRGFASEPTGELMPLSHIL